MDAAMDGGDGWAVDYINMEAITDSKVSGKILMEYMETIEGVLQIPTDGRGMQQCTKSQIDGREHMETFVIDYAGAAEMQARSRPQPGSASQPVPTA